MSADAWVECPICKKKEEEMADQYGKIPLAEYDKLKQEFREKQESISDDGDTARVDYEYWHNEDGTFEVRISSYCEVCGTEWDIRAKAEPKTKIGD